VRQSAYISLDRGWNNQCAKAKAVAASDLGSFRKPKPGKFVDSNP
jgi:hypothetical protein